MAYPCCPVCCLRLPAGASGKTGCPICERALEPVSARAALGYRLLEIADSPPLNPTADAVAVALTSAPTVTIARDPTPTAASRRPRSLRPSWLLQGEQAPADVHLTELLTRPERGGARRARTTTPSFAYRREAGQADAVVP
jgi:hypothetical protein